VTADWGAEFTVSGVEWCRTGSDSALAYTLLREATFGNPILAHPHPVSRGEDPYTVTEREAIRLRAREGRRGLKRKAYKHFGGLERECQALS
jgi:hypothetical protein